MHAATSNGPGIGPVRSSSGREEKPGSGASAVMQHLDAWSNELHPAMYRWVGHGTISGNHATSSGVATTAGWMGDMTAFPARSRVFERNGDQDTARGPASGQDGDPCIILSRIEDGFSVCESPNDSLIRSHQSSRNATVTPSRRSCVVMSDWTPGHRHGTGNDPTRIRPAEVWPPD